MPRSAPARRSVPPRPPVDDDDDTPSGRGLGWAIYGGLAFVGFCFGVWAGTQRPKVIEAAKPIEVAKVTTSGTKAEPRNDPKPEPAETEPPKKEPAPKSLTPPETKMPDKEPKPPEAMTPEPKPEPKPKPKPPEPKPQPKTPAVTQVSFNEVETIFKSKCNLCHGNSKGVKGGLDLRTLASIMKGGDSGAAFKPGDLKNSQIWVTIDDGSMPPAGKDPLTDAEKQKIHDWILSGGK